MHDDCLARELLFQRGVDSALDGSEQAHEGPVPAAQNTQWCVSAKVCST